MNEKVILSGGAQLAIVIFSSLAAVHLLTQLDTSIQIDGIPIYYYFTHVLAIILLLSLYSAVRTHNHPGSVYLVLFFSILLPITWLFLSSVPLLPNLSEAFQPLTYLGTDQTKQFFPIVTFIVTAMIGIFSAIIAPTNRGKCFVIFLFVLALPAIFAESMVDWPLFFHDMAGVCERLHVSAVAPLFSICQEIFILLTSNSRVNQFELYPLCFGLLAGYIVLRYATRIALIQQELSERGASTSDTASISRGVIIIAAMAATSIAPVAFAATLAPLMASHIASIIQLLLSSLPALTLLLGIGVGTIALATNYIFTRKAVGLRMHETRGKKIRENVQAPPKVEPVPQHRPQKKGVADATGHRLPDPLCLVSVLLGLILLSAGSIWTMQTFDLLDNCVETEGTVVGFNWESSWGSYRSHLAYPVFQFMENRTGEEIRFVGRSGSNPPKYTIGQKVHLLYDLQDPQNAVFIEQSGEEIRLRSTIMPVSGGSFLAIGLIYYWLYARKRRA